MKHIITCICLMFATGLLAQSTPISSSEARKVNMSRVNGKTALTNTQTMTDSNVSATTIGYIGVQTTAVDGGLEIIGFDAGNSTAKAAKFEVGDIITSINSKEVTTIDELNAEIEAYKPGDVIPVSYTRGHRNLTKDVRINRK